MMELVGKLGSDLYRETDPCLVYGRITHYHINQRGRRPAVCFEGIVRLATEDAQGNLMDLAQSRRCFLPQTAADALVIACETAEQTSEDGTWQVDFGIRLTKKPEKTAPGGYVWQVEPFVEEEERPDLLQGIAEKYKSLGPGSEPSEGEEEHEEF